MFGPTATRRSTHGMIAADHHLASSAGLEMLVRNGNAVDAAVAAASVMAVVAPHSSGLGGDLFAVVHDGSGPPEVLEAVGRSGSGSDAASLRADGHREMPVTADLRSVTVPGCVDGWVALHGDRGRLPLADVLEPAVRLAAGGFVVSVELRAAVDAVGSAEFTESVLGERSGSGMARRSEVAEVLRGLGTVGRDSFYRGRFAEQLAAMAPGLFTEDDLGATHSRWVSPLVGEMWGHQVWVPPPPSQAYVLLAAGWIASRLDLPDAPEDPMWAHLVSESLRQAASDRVAVLHEDADGWGLVDPERLAARVASISPDTISPITHERSPGCTTYLCAVDGGGLGVSLIQSIASVFGSQIVVPGTGVILHNRGRGFSLQPGHPAELEPGRRPPHTLAPAMVTTSDGALRLVLGTRGADAQPQVVLQLLARLLLHAQSPRAALQAGRWLLAHPSATPFGTWDRPDQLITKVEADVVPFWRAGLVARGHDVVVADPGDHTFGSAHVIAIDDGVLAGAPDPRTPDAAAIGR